ncbi:MAG: hypothetical protein QNJ92_06895 [Alphaproteobacteria bacterium]|nr:hypothetical protein [Alphaproteobacteria bacterium]
MPFIPESDRQVPAPVGRLPEEQTGGPGFLDAIGPALRTETTIGSVVSNWDTALGYDQPFDPDYDPFTEIEGYEEFADSFVNSFHPESTARIKRQIDKEREDRDLIASAGGAGIAASIAAGFLDPINFIPVGGTAVRAATAGRRLLDGAASTARAGLLSTTGAETVLQATQEARTIGESAVNIAAGTALSGILGTAAAAAGNLLRGARGLEVDLPNAPVAERVRATETPAGEVMPTPAANFFDRAFGAITDADGQTRIEVDGQGFDVTVQGRSASIQASDNVRVDVAWSRNVTAQDAAAFPQIRQRYNPALAETDVPGEVRYTWDVDRTDAAGNQQRIRYEATTTGRPGDVERLRVSRSPRRAEPSARRRGPRRDPEMFRMESGLDRDLSVRAGPDPVEEGFVRVSEDEAARDFTLRPQDLPDPDLPEVRATAGSAAGAQSARATIPDETTGGFREPTLAEEGLKSALGLERAVAFQDPLLRTATSPAISTRRATQRLAESPLTYEKNRLGIPTQIGGSVETRAKLWQAPLAEAIAFTDDAFTRYRKGRSKQFGDIARIGASDLAGQARRTGKLTFGQFKDRIGQAMRNGDRSDIPEVAEAAKFWRETVYDPLKDEAIGLNIFDEDVGVTTAESYLQRVYNVERIAARRFTEEGTGFTDIVTGWLVKERNDAAAAIPELRRDIVEDTARVSGASVELRALETGHARTLRELRRRRDVLRERQRAGREGTRRAETEARQAERRAEQLKPSPRPERDDPVRELVGDIRRGGPREQPQRLASFLRRQGGIQDEGGEVSAIGGSARERPGLISGRGLTLDDAALRAWEEGFFTSFGDERPGIQDLLDALTEDLSGNPRVRDRDLDLLERQEAVAMLSDDLVAEGLDLTNATDAQILAALDRRVFRPETAAGSGQVREARLGARRAVRRILEADERLSRVEDDLDAVEDALRVQRARGAEVRAEASELRSRLREARKSRDDNKKKLAQAEYRSGFEDQELANTADQITDRILGTPDGRLPYDATADIDRAPYGGRKRGALRGPLRGRVFNIPDNLIEEFLESDIEMMGRIYTRTLAPDLELIREFGDADMTTEIAAITAEYARMARANAGDEKTLTRLQKRKDADIRDVSAMRDRIRGTYQLGRINPDGVISRAGRIARNLNYLRLLGGMTVSAFPDMFRAVMIHGIGRTMGDGVVPLITNLRNARLAMKEVRRAGTALDMIMDSRTMAIAEVLDDYGRYSRFERGLRGLTNNFGFVSLMAPWNSFWKGFSGMITTARLLDGAAAWRNGQIGPRDLEAMAASGIDREMAERIANQFDAHGETHEGLKLANTAFWDDREAARALQAAIVRDVDRIIVTPGQDKPLWMSTELGSVIGQFKSFAMASVQRTMLAGLQDRNAGTYAGAMMMFGGGMAVYAFKSWDAGRELSDDPRQWMVEGLDRSGLFGWFFEANNVVERATRGTVGVTGLLGGPQLSRFAARNTAGALLGPTFGLAGDLFSVTGAAATGEVSRSDVRAARRMVPYQNLLGFRQIFDEVESGITDVFNIPQRTGR